MTITDIATRAGEVTSSWGGGQWTAAIIAGLLGLVSLALVLWRLVRLYRATKTRLGTWTSKQWIMVAVSAIAIALTILSIHGIQAALERIGITSWYGKLSAVIAFEMFLGLCAFLSYRERMSDRDGANPYGLMVWILAGLMGAAGAWGGGSWLYATFPLLAAVAWEFALHAEATWRRTNIDTDRAKTWWADTKSTVRAKLDLRNRRIKKLVAASLALSSADVSTVNKAAVRQQKYMSALMTAGEWSTELKTEVENRVRDLATASVALSPATLAAGGTNAGTTGGTKPGSNGGTNNGTVAEIAAEPTKELTPEVTAELSPELTTELKAIFDADISGSNGGTVSGTSGGTVSGTNRGSNAGTKAKAKRRKRGKRGSKRAAVRRYWDEGLTDSGAIFEAVSADGVSVTARYVRNLISEWTKEK